MGVLATLSDVAALKLLGDRQRMQILRRLMIKPATLSQLGDAFNEQPAQIRHHLKLLEKAGLVELESTQIVRGFVEKYYRAGGAGLLSAISGVAG